MSEHPSDTHGHLFDARCSTERLIDDARMRGDTIGAEAWQCALDAIDNADATLRKARTLQDWRRR